MSNAEIKFKVDSSAVAEALAELKELKAAYEASETSVLALAAIAKSQALNPSAVEITKAVGDITISSRIEF